MSSSPSLPFPLLCGGSLARLLASHAADRPLPPSLVLPLLAHLRGSPADGTEIRDGELQDSVFSPASLSSSSSPSLPPSSTFPFPPSPSPSPSASSALLRAVSVFEARHSPAAAADLRAFHTEGFLHLPHAFDASSALASLAAASPWEPIPDRFGDAAPHRAAPYREMCDASLPDLREAVTAAARQCNIHFEAVHFHASTKLLRSMPGVPAQDAHMDGPHIIPLSDCEVRPAAARPSRAAAFTAGHWPLTFSFLLPCPLQQLSPCPRSRPTRPSPPLTPTRR